MNTNFGKILKPFRTLYAPKYAFGDSFLPTYCSFATNSFLFLLLKLFAKYFAWSISFQRHLQNPLKHLRWSDLQKYLRALTRQLILQENLRRRCLTGFWMRLWFPSYWLIDAEWIFRNYDIIWCISLTRRLTWSPNSALAAPLIETSSYVVKKYSKDLAITREKRDFIYKFLLNKRNCANLTQSFNSTHSNLVSVWLGPPSWKS